MPWCHTEALIPIFLNIWMNFVIPYKNIIKPSSELSLHMWKNYFENRAYSFLQNDLYTDILIGDCDTTNTSLEAINAKFNKGIVGGFQSPGTIARAIFNFKYNYINEKYCKLTHDRMNKRQKNNATIWKND